MSLGIANAVKQSGLADVLAHIIVRIGDHFGVLGVLASIYFFTSIYTLVITNNAAAAMLFPIAVSAASAINVDQRGFAIAIMIAASASFATPISYQTNLMVYSPGGYRFRDYLMIGAPLQLGIGAIAIALIYCFYF